jgi:hypothetical protein
MCQQKNSDGASLREEKTCPDCLMTKNRPEVGLERAGRFIHHLQWQHLHIQIRTLRVALNKPLAGSHLVAHQHIEDLIGLNRFLDAHL